MTELSAQAVMAAGYKRIKSIQDRYGINSQEVLDACIRWGGILDDINFPDTTCRNCGDPVSYSAKVERYVHTLEDINSPSAVHCKRRAAGQAQAIDKAKVYAKLYGARDVELNQAEQRFVLTGTTTGRLSQTTPDLKNLPEARTLGQWANIKEELDKKQAEGGKIYDVPSSPSHEG